MVRHPCPPANRWRALLADDLPPAEQADLSGHLELCPACQRTLEECAAHRDAWTAARSLGALTQARSPVLSDVIDQLKLDPESDHGSSDGAQLPLDFLDPPDRPGPLGRIGQYEVLEEVGRGGMGVVLKALDPGLHRVVAIKVLAPQLAVSGTARKRFTREARAAAAVGHENVVTIHAVEEFKGLPYLVMQYVAGPSVQQRLADGGPLPVAEILRIGFQTAAGLAAAHAQGLIHRDVKPANILLENGVERVKLTDFSLARAIDDASVTQTGVVTGTPPYMAPEQARGEPLDHRADLFSLGSVLYALCTGRAPFRGKSLDVLRKVSEETPVSIRTLNPEIPAWLEAIVKKLMAKNPEERYQSAGEVSALLERCLAHVQQPTVVPLPVGIADKAKRRRPNRTAILTGVVAAAAILIAATVLRIKTDNGTLEITLYDPNATVTVDKTDIVVSGIQGVKEFHLKAGDYTVHQTKDGKPEKTEVVSIKQGEKTPLRVTFEGDISTARKAEGIPEARLAGDLEMYRRMGQVGRRVIQPQRTFPNTLGEVQSAVFSPDGKTLFAADRASCICAYDFVTGRARFTVNVSNGGDSLSLAVSPDGATLAVVGITPMIYLVDAETGKVRNALAGNLSEYYAVAFSANGKTLAAGGTSTDGRRGGLLELWDLASEKVRSVEFPKPVRSLAVPPGREDRLAVGTDGPDVHLVYPSTGREEYALRQHGPVRAMGFSPDGKWLAASTANLVDVWDWHRGQAGATLTGHATTVTTGQFSPDSRWCVTASLDGTAKLWDMSLGEMATKTYVRRCATIAPGTYKTGMGVALFTPDGKSVVTAGDDHEIRVWDLTSLPVASEAARPAGADEQRSRADYESALARARAAQVAADRAEATAQESEKKAAAGQVRQTTAQIDRAKAEAAKLKAEVSEEEAKMYHHLWETWNQQAAAEVGALTTQSRRSFPTALGEVSSAAFSPDGKLLLAADSDGKLRCSDFATGQDRFALESSKAAQICFVAIAPDGQTFATVGNDPTVHIWDMKTNERGTVSGKANLAGKLAQYRAVAFSPDGKTLAAGGCGPDGSRGLLELWDLASGNVRTVEFSNCVTSLAFQPGGADRLAIGTAGDHVRIFSTSTAKEVTALGSFTSGMIGAVAFAPDGKWIAWSDDNEVNLCSWPSTSGGPRLVGHGGRVTMIQFSPDSTRLLTASLDGTAKLWDVATRKLAATFAPGTYKTGMGVALFSPDGKSIVTAGGDQAIRVWDLRVGPTTGATAVPSPEKVVQTKAVRAPEATRMTQPQRTFEANPGGPILSAVFTPDGKSLIIAGEKRPVQEFSLQNGAAAGSTVGRLGDSPIVAMSRDGKSLAMPGENGVIHFGHVSTEKDEMPNLSTNVTVIHTLAYDPFDKMLAVGGQTADGKGILALCNLLTGTNRRIEFPAPVLSLAVDMSGRFRLAVGLDAESVRIVDPREAKETFTLRQPGPVATLACSPDGQHLAASNGASKVYLWVSPNQWRVASDLGKSTFSGHADRVTSVRFSPDGKWLATASLDGMAKLWDVATGRCVATFAPIMGKLYVAEFSPDGKWLATAGEDRTIRMWDLTSLRADPKPEVPAGLSR